MTQVIEDNKETHAQYHRNIFLYGFSEAGEYPLHEGFGNTVCYKVACENIECETQKRVPTLFVKTKGEIFIEQITDNTPKEIIGG